MLLLEFQGFAGSYFTQKAVQMAFSQSDGVWFGDAIYFKFTPKEEKHLTSFIEWRNDGKHKRYDKLTRQAYKLKIDQRLVNKDVKPKFSRDNVYEPPQGKGKDVGKGKGKHVAEEEDAEPVKKKKKSSKKNVVIDSDDLDASD